MLIYNINLLIVYIMSILSRYFYQYDKYKILQNIFIVSMFISIWMVSGLRYNVGTDFKSYEILFENVDNYDITNSVFELGYLILNKITKLLINDSQVIFLITSLIVLILIVRTVYKYSSKLELSMYLFINLYFYYESLNIIRQYIAIAVMFYAVKYVYNRNFIKYILCILVASLFHTSAIFSFPIYFMYNFKLTNVKILKGLLVSMIILNLVQPVFNIISLFIPRYSYYSGGELFSTGTYRSIIIMGTIFFIAYIKRKTLIQNDYKNNLYINVLFIAFMLSFMGLKSVLFIRIMVYFSIYSIMIIPNIVNTFDTKLKPIIYLLVITISYVYAYLLLSINDGGVLPYMVR